VDDQQLPRGVASVDGPAVVHFDGACQSTRAGRVATYGFTIDGAGIRFEEHGLCVPPNHARATNNVAEYTAAIRALEWLVGQGYAGPVVVVGDSQLVLRQMTGEYRVDAEHLRPYHEWLGRLAARFRSVEYRWVPREENGRADALSKLAVEETVVARRARRSPGPKEVADGSPDGAEPQP
jgi:ribonuclease HI